MTVLFDEDFEVLENNALADGIYYLKLDAEKTSESILPGQFVHMRVENERSCMLRRPFSVFDVDKDAGTISIIYAHLGKGTGLMTKWEQGTRSRMIAPLGKGWGEDTGELAKANKVLLVGGGLGGAPLYMLAKKYCEQGSLVDVVLGAVTSEQLVLHPFFEKLSLNRLEPSTDDGSIGYEGYCTDVAEKLMCENEYDYVATCGLKPVMQKVSDCAGKHGIRCQVSSEGYMACGVGACKTCVIETRFDRLRSCADGPIFEGSDILW